MESLDGAVERLRLELEDSEDIASIYEAEDFTVEVEDTEMVIRAGGTELLRLPNAAEVCCR